MNVIEIDENNMKNFEDKLSTYDELYSKSSLNGVIRLGIEEDGVLLASLEAVVTTFNILYLSTLYVEASHRGKGLGTTLIHEMEKRAKKIGVNTIRLDTFSWQGKEFYETLGYEIVGHYANQNDGYAEYFFLKRI